MSRSLLTTLLASFSIISNAQVKSISAQKTDQFIRIDGERNEAAWDSIHSISDFITSIPQFGQTPPLKTSVKITYDNLAVYILAYLYDDPKNIRKQLTARDDLDYKDTDVFSVGLDTYEDKQNGFLFKVSAAGVQGDAKLSSFVDDSWDAVWESKVNILKDGWVVEIKIPFSAIRFSKNLLQNWGIQFTRFRRLTNETFTWSPDNIDISGTINKWGRWDGLQNIVPPMRLSFLPYISGTHVTSPIGNTTTTEFLKSGGMDVKYGINESFTLDLTLIPDFAQVQSDNNVLNLTPFDIKFDDYRPFFTEGTELFEKAGIFYSRRIGNAPQKVHQIHKMANYNPQYEVIKNPGITRLYNATKLSGRTNSNLGIGIFNAVAAPMFATIRDKSSDSILKWNTEPLTNYNIIVLDQALKNRSSITFTNSNVLRKGNSRNANVAALDISLYDKKNQHHLYIDGAYSAIWGNVEKYDGYKANAQFQKVSGQFQYLFSANVLSDKYDPNDLGFLLHNNQVSFSNNWVYLINQPSKTFLKQRYSIGITDIFLFKPFQWQNVAVNASSFVLFNNYWDVSAQLQVQPIWSNDYFELRTPGNYLKRPPLYYLSVVGSTDSRKKVFINYAVEGAETPLSNDLFYGTTLGLRYRFNNNFQMNTELHLENDNCNYGYAFREAINQHAVLGQRTVRSNYTVLGANYNLNALMHFKIRLRHYWSHVTYHKFYYVEPNGHWIDRAFEPGQDFNYNSFNVDLFYTWDFLPGSRVTLSWKNALGADVYIDAGRDQSYLYNFKKAFQYPHSNEISLKTVYYLDYLYLKRQPRSR